jgi:outer membrane protein TolC
LRNARDAAALRFLGTSEGRNYFVTRLVAGIAENDYGLMALDKRLENLDKTIELQEQSLEIAQAKKEAARGTELAVQRFQAEVRKNQSQKLIVKQERSSRSRTVSTSSSVATRSLSDTFLRNSSI